MIREVTEALIRLILSKTSDIGDWVEATSLHGGVTTNPTADKLHVCLYAVDEHGHLRNQPLVATPDGYRRPPLMLRLQYVMAYFGNDHLEAQSRLARVVQVLYDTPILGPALLPPALATRVGQVTVRLRNPDAEERSQIWTGLGRPMRLALYYDADVAPVDSIDKEGWGQIDRRVYRYGTVPQ